MNRQKHTAPMQIPAKMCACGKPLHYKSEMIKRKVEKISENQGDYITVTLGARTWRVQRHYIALHGLKAGELPSLGFEEIKPL